MNMVRRCGDTRKRMLLLLLRLLQLLLLLEVVRRVEALRRLGRTRVLLMLMLVLLHAGLVEPAAAAKAGRAMVATARRMVEPVVRVWGVLV